MVRKLSVVLIAGLVLAIFAPGCSPPVSLAQTAVSLTTIQKGSYSGVREPLQIVIRDQQEWVALWARHTSIRDKSPPAQEIDFSAEMVVALFLGQKSTGGYSVEITRAGLDGSNLRFYYRERSPTPGAMVTQALTQPYHLVRLSRSESTPVFVKQSP